MSMTSSTTTGAACPHCGAANSSAAAFCESCGKALPSRVQASPRIVTQYQGPASSAAQDLVAGELEKQAKKAATALMWVAILQTIGVLIFAFLLQNPPPNLEIDGVVVGVIGVVAAIFWGLFFWARRSPLPAAIVGLILFITLHVIGAIADPSSIAQGWLIKIIVIVVLARAISAGMKHRQLMAERGGAV